MAVVRFHDTAESSPPVAASSFSRATAMSLSPPFHSDPWPIIMRCADSVARPPTMGSLCIARS